uniref:Uncharacterized protein n=1 Tax=Tanacetum cinerariifolium TaxID=118510 RepID=A0A6L2LG24_TANCI|nr:hypothetical protein [Tanacetum cinerariifolium]
MTTLAEFMILSGRDNHPPMLDKDLVTRTKKYAELSPIEKIQADCDLKETNIILQGLPSNIYTLVNHHRVAKDLSERIQLLMQVNQQTHLAEFAQIDSGLAILMFKQGDDPSDAINKIMLFMSTVVTSRLSSTDNQLRNSSNPRQQATIYDERIVDSIKRDEWVLRSKREIFGVEILGKFISENNEKEKEEPKCFWETVHETNIDVVFREVNTIIGKLIEQGLIMGVGVGLERPPSSHQESIGTQA